MKSNLIIIEGIPGSGKTTTAQFVRDWIAGKGLDPLVYLEDSSYHPVDLDNLSYLEDEQYGRFIERYSEYQSIIGQISEKCTNGYFIYYRCWNEFTKVRMPDDLFGGLLEYDAHDTLHPDMYHALMMERWQNFSERAKKENKVIVFECCFLQNPLTFFVGKHNYEIDQAKSIILELSEWVDDLNPIMIFLTGEHVREIFQRVIATRPQVWIDYVTDYINGQGYGKARNFDGLEGVIRFYEMFQDVENEIVSNLDWKKAIVNISNWNWEQQNQQIVSLLVGNL